MPMSCCHYNFCYLGEPRKKEEKEENKNTTNKLEKNNLISEKQGDKKT